MSYTWLGTLFSTDMIYGSGLRANLMLPDGNSIPNGAHLAAYVQFNLGVSRAFSVWDAEGFTARFDIINLFDEKYEIRNGTGVGVGAPQWGPRRGFFVGLSRPSDVPERTRTTRTSAQGNLTASIAEFRTFPCTDSPATPEGCHSFLSAGRNWRFWRGLGAQKIRRSRILKLSEKLKTLATGTALAGLIGAAGISLAITPAAAQMHGGGDFHGGGGGFHGGSGGFHGGSGGFRGGGFRGGFRNGFRGGFRGGWWHGRWYGPGWGGWGVGVGFYGYPYAYGYPYGCSSYDYYYGYCGY